MEITHGSQMSFVDIGAKHRSGGIAFKILSKGIEGTPENYVFELARQEDFFSPQHRHNFDQFRFAVKGDFSLGPDLVLKEGQLAYHPEGVFYGPQNDGPEERVLLLLQFGGASGSGFMSMDQVRASSQELTKIGTFDGGKFYAHGGQEMEPVDGFEAVWSHYNKGKKLIYPAGRYNAPILMDPKNFVWRQQKPGVQYKPLGVFSEREARVEMHKIDSKGSFDAGGDNAIHLLYVLNGTGQVGEEKLTPQSAIRLSAGEQCTVSSEEGIELLHFTTPMLS